MKTKETFDSKPLNMETPMKAKPKSLRPMRSLMASRSFKPRTVVANMILKSEETEKKS